MAEEILESPAAAKNAVEAISKIISQLEWPPKDKKLFWERTFEELTAKGRHGEDFSPSDAEYKRLHRLLERYFASKDFSVISRFKRNLKTICFNLESPLLSEPPLTDKRSEKKLQFLLDDILRNPECLEDVAIPLLKVNLRQRNGIEILKIYLPKIFASFKSSQNAELKNISAHLPLYIDKKALFQNLHDTDEKTFYESLAKTGILEKFCNQENRFFTDEFSLWLISRRKLNLDIISKNFELIKQCTPDEEKIIQAFFVCNVYNQKAQDGYEEIQNLIDLMQMKNADEAFFWQVSNQKLQERFKQVLSNAYRIVRTMITTDFISYVFNFLGSNSENDQRRIQFWRKYAGSVVDFKIFYSRYEKSRFQNAVLRAETSKSKAYADVINSHSLIDSGENGETALIFKFEKLIIVEFPKTGKPVQIYQKTNPISKIFEPRRMYASFSVIRQYKDSEGERFSEDEREGSFAHRGYWEAALAQYLQKYLIFTDKGRR